MNRYEVLDAHGKGQRWANSPAAAATDTDDTGDNITETTVVRMPEHDTLTAEAYLRQYENGVEHLVHVRLGPAYFTR